MDDRPVAVIENGAIFYIRTDHIGRPVLATESIGGVIHVVGEARYLPFGGVEIVTGVSASHADIRFPRQWFQSEHGLHQNWMRDYDPVTGRYLQADPLWLVDGASVYGYALQNPMGYTDFYGMEAATINRVETASSEDGEIGAVRRFLRCVDANNPFRAEVLSAIYAVCGPIPKSWSVRLLELEGQAFLG